MNESFDIKSILKNVFEDIENKALGESISGIPVNFYDLDAMTLEGVEEDERRSAAA